MSVVIAWKQFHYHRRANVYRSRANGAEMARNDMINVYLSLNIYFILLVSIGLQS